MVIITPTLIKWFHIKWTAILLSYSIQTVDVSAGGRCFVRVIFLVEGFLPSSHRDARQCPGSLMTLQTCFLQWNITIEMFPLKDKFLDTRWLELSSRPFVIFARRSTRIQSHKCIQTFTTGEWPENLLQVFVPSSLHVIVVDFMLNNFI